MPTYARCLPVTMSSTEIIIWSLLAGGACLGFGIWLGRRKSETRSEQPAITMARQQVAAPADLGWVDALPDAAIVLDARRRVMKANAACSNTLGPIPKGASIELYLRQPQVIDALDEAARNTAPAERELVLLSPRERMFLLRVSPLKYSQGFLVTLHDMTRARLTDRMRVDFVANASHELRTPLATLIGFIETLQTGAAEDETVRDKFLGIMNSESQRMVRLIDDLLSLSRIELDKYVRPATPLKLRAVIEDVQGSLLMRLKDDGRALAIDVPANLPDVVADRDQIIQVLHNLVSNAIKYGRSGTAIVVTAQRKDADMISLSVADEGDGIAPEFVPRLTERFFRVDTARSREMGGTGLGLAIVKHIVERHRGTLAIESQPGKGTTVQFSLPVASVESVSAAAHNIAD
jgi:two-component system, OmpR family, phosphate regulon sensor histidine kinase PhoR